MGAPLDPGDDEARPDWGVIRPALRAELEARVPLELLPQVLDCAARGALHQARVRGAPAATVPPGASAGSARRHSVRPRRRMQVLARDGFACRYCGARPPAAVLEVDHVVPRALGGSDALDNLVTACTSCNEGKGAQLLVPPGGTS